MAPCLSGNARTSQLVRARQSVVKFPKGKEDRKAAPRPSSLLRGLGPEPPKRRGAAAPTGLEQAQLRSLVKRLAPSPSWATALDHMTRALQEGALRRAFLKAESRRAQGPSLVSLWAWAPEECSDQLQAVLSGPVTCMAYDSVRAILWNCQYSGAVSECLVGRPDCSGQNAQNRCRVPCETYIHMQPFCPSPRIGNDSPWGSRGQAGPLPPSLSSASGIQVPARLPCPACLPSGASPGHRTGAFWPGAATAMSAFLTLGRGFASKQMAQLCSTGAGASVFLILPLDGPPAPPAYGPCSASR